MLSMSLEFMQLSSKAVFFSKEDFWTSPLKNIGKQFDFKQDKNYTILYKQVSEKKVSEKSSFTNFSNKNKSYFSNELIIQTLNNIQTCRKSGTDWNSDSLRTVSPKYQPAVLSAMITNHEENWIFILILLKIGKFQHILCYSFILWMH